MRSETQQAPQDDSPVRPYANLPLVMPAAGTYAPVPERAWLIAWGRGPLDLRTAYDAGHAFAADHGCTIVATIASFSDEMTDGVLVLNGVRRYARREVTADIRGWWLVPYADLDIDTGLVGRDLCTWYMRDAGIGTTAVSSHRGPGNTRPESPRPLSDAGGASGANAVFAGHGLTRHARRHPGPGEPLRD